VAIPSKLNPRPHPDNEFLWSRPLVATVRSGSRPVARDAARISRNNLRRIAPSWRQHEQLLQARRAEVQNPIRVLNYFDGIAPQPEA